MTEDISSQRCPKCNTSYDSGKYCPECGAALETMKTAIQKPPKTKKSRRLIYFYIALAIISTAVASALAFSGPGRYRLSPEQDQIIGAFGAPQQFSLAYLPSSDKAQRVETWYYPEHYKKITFAGGKVVSIDELYPEFTKAEYPAFKPQDFTEQMTADDVTEMLGGEIIRIDVLPELAEIENTQVYAADKLVFATQNGRLVYVETLGRRIQ